MMNWSKPQDQSYASWSFKDLHATLKIVQVNGEKQDASYRMLSKTFQKTLISTIATSASEMGQSYNPVKVASLQPMDFIAIGHVRATQRTTMTRQT